VKRVVLTPPQGRLIYTFLHKTVNNAQNSNNPLRHPNTERSSLPKAKQA